MGRATPNRPRPMRWAAQAGSNGPTPLMSTTPPPMSGTRARRPKPPPIQPRPPTMAEVREAGLKAAQGQVVRGMEGTTAYPGWQIPVTTPPIGITAGIDIGITSIYVGGTLAINWLFGNLYAKKADLKKIRAAARRAGIKSEEDYWEFSDSAPRGERSSGDSKRLP